MQLEPLEARECPTFLGSRDGWILTPDDGDFIPFPDFLADHASAGDAETIVVGAAAGGGPRVQVRVDGKVTADFFAFEPSFRDGVNVALGGNGEGDLVVVGAAAGGGPVVAVYDREGHELARFFAYDPTFRGGVSVAVRNDRILTVPGPGGGPHVRAFDFHGAPIGGDFYGDDPDRRDGWDLIVGDVTHDLIDDVVLATRTGRIAINEGTTGGRQIVALPPDYTRAGYEGETIAVGNETNYLRGRALWTSFETMTGFDETDAAAGNPNPPATTGTRPGVYHPVTDIAGEPDLAAIAATTLSQVNISGSVGTDAVGTGSSYVPLYDADGSQYLVTASHVARRSPFDPLWLLPPLLAPGRIDGASKLAGSPTCVSTIAAIEPYVVDAVAFRPAEGVVLTDEVRFGDQSIELDGVADAVVAGDVLLAVGRGRVAGVGRVAGEQANPVPIRWPSGETVSIGGQIVGIRGAVALAVPGFSGGVALRLSWSPEGVMRELVGMVVAGNNTFVFITPHAAIEQALGLNAKIT